MAALTISIDRTGLSLSPLVMSASPTSPTTLGVTDYAEPAMQMRIRYAPTSDYIHGDTALSAVYQQTVLSFNVLTRATSETASRAAVAELRAALAQFSFTTTVTISDAAAEVWDCNPGSLAPISARSRVDLTHFIPVWGVTIPCYPVRS